VLGLLGVIYYLLAIGAVYLGVSQHHGFGGGITLVATLAAGVSFAFFGAMCFAANDIRTLLRRIADNLPRGGGAAGEDVTRMTLQRLDAPATREPDGPIDTPSAGDAITPDSASSVSNEPVSPVDAEPRPASSAEVPSPPLSEKEQMAEYDIVHDGTSFLAYGRVRHATLGAAVAYVKSTRGERD
jgi:hypothetical protein